MAILIKGIDLPKDDNYIVLEIEKNGTVEAYSSTFGDVNGDPIAIQIDRPHCNDCKYNENGYCTMWFAKIEPNGYCYKAEE